VRDGDTVVVTKLDRLARFLPDAGHHRGPDQTEGEAQHRRVHPRPRRPVGRLLFNVLAVVAEFESDLNQAPTREGMQVAKAKGRLRGKQPNSPGARKPTSSLYKGGQHTTAEIAELFEVARGTVYRIYKRALSGQRATDQRSLWRTQSTRSGSCPSLNYPSNIEFKVQKSLGRRWPSRNGIRGDEVGHHPGWTNSSH
jgi:DNA invertase Pin-like site-specific DNA recombinase